MPPPNSSDQGEPNDAPKVGSQSFFDSAADRLRESARWLVIASGGAATVVFAGVSLAGIGELEPSDPGYRLQIAVGGALVAVIGALAALGIAMRLASASSVSLSDLSGTRQRGWRRVVRDELCQDPLLAYWRERPGSETAIERFAASYARAYADWVKKHEAWLNDEEPNPDTRFVDASARRLLRVQSFAAPILSSASYLRLRHHFRWAALQIPLALVLAGMGGIAVAWAANPAPTEASTRPPFVLADIDEDVKAGVKDDLGQRCEYDLDELPAVLASDLSEELATIITAPTPECRPLRLKLAPSRLQVQSD
jgi:hypothetical protein